MKGTIWLDEGEDVFPYEFSIENDRLYLLADIFSRTPNRYRAIVRTWHCTSDPDLSVVFYTDQHAVINGQDAKWYYYEFDAGSMKGTIWHDSAYHDDFFIEGGSLYLDGDTYTRD